MAADANQRDAQRSARTILNKHGFDTARAQISVQHGICFIRGFLIPLPGHKIVDVEGEAQRVAQFIRQKPGVRQVVLEVTFR